MTADRLRAVYVDRPSCGCKTLSFSVFGLSFNIWFRWACRGYPA